MSDFFFTKTYTLSLFLTPIHYGLLFKILFVQHVIFTFQNLRFPPILQSISLLKIRHIKCIHSKKCLLKRHYSSSLAHKVQIMESELQQKIKNAIITYINSLISSFFFQPRSLYSHLSHSLYIQKFQRHNLVLSEIDPLFNNFFYHILQFSILWSQSNTQKLCFLILPKP